MIHFNTDIIDKSMCDRILSVLKERGKAKAINIAYALGTDRRTINHYLYSDLRDIVIKDDYHYWSIKGTYPMLTQEGIYYLTDYIPKGIWEYKSEEAVEDSKLVIQLKDNDQDAIDTVKEKMAAAAEELIDPSPDLGLIVAAVPSSKTYKNSPMLKVAAYIRDCFNGIDGEDDPELSFLDMFTRTSDVTTSHFVETWNRPGFDEQKASIQCNYPEFCSEDNTCLIIDDVTTTGRVMKSCKEILVENGMPEENIIMLAFAKTSR